MANSRNSEPPEPLLAAVGACLRRHVRAPARLLLGFSGGRDSLAMLHALRMLRPDFGYELSALHVNHGISVEADRWQTFCVHCCAELDVALRCERVEVPRDAAEGLEAAARTLRHAALARVAADWVVLAHHRGDQAETLLFNLLRGAGLRGAAAMRETRSFTSASTLIRPFLALSRGDIDAYLQAHELTWIDDASNADIGFSRNYVRHQVLPLLTARFPAAEAKLASAARHFAEAEQLLDALARLDLGAQPPEFPLPVAKLVALDDARGRNLLRFMLAQRSIPIASEQRLGEFLRQVRSAGPDRHPSVVFGSSRLSCRGRQVHLEYL